MPSATDFLADVKPPSAEDFLSDVDWQGADTAPPGDAAAHGGVSVPLPPVTPPLPGHPFTEQERKDMVPVGDPFQVGSSSMNIGQGPIPTFRAPQDAGTLEKVASGIWNTAASIPNFLVTPSGAALAVAPELAAGRFIAPALKGVFSGLMAKSAGEAAGTASVTKDAQDITEAGGAALLAGVPMLLPEGAKALQETPTTPEGTKGTETTQTKPATTEAPDASGQQKAAEVHGDVQSQPESQGQVPAEKSGAGVQPQAAQSEVVLSEQPASAFAGAAGSAEAARAEGEKATTADQLAQLQAGEKKAAAEAKAANGAADKLAALRKKQFFTEAVRAATPRVAAAQTGWTFNPSSQVGGMSTEGLPPEILAQLPKQWEFTDRRKSSPTEGTTLYVPEGATHEEVLQAVGRKAAEVLAARGVDKRGQAGQAAPREILEPATPGMAVRPPAGEGAETGTTGRAGEAPAPAAAAGAAAVPAAAPGGAQPAGGAETGQVLAGAGVAAQPQRADAAGAPGDLPTTAKEVTPDEEKEKIKENEILSSGASPTAVPPPVAGAGGGAAELGEIQPTGPRAGETPTYGVAARVLEERRQRGVIAPVEPGQGIGAEASVNRGRELLAAGADPEQIMSAFEKSKRFSADDLATARAHGEKLEQAAYQAADQHGVDSPEYEKAWEADSAWSQRLKAMSTEWHKSGMAQQGETEIDTGTFHGLRKAHLDQTGKDFTPEQAGKARDVSERVKQAGEEAGAAETKLFKHISREASGLSEAEQDALDAASKAVRDNAARIAAAETKVRVADQARQTAVDKLQQDVEKRVADSTSKTVRDAAARLAAAETKSRVAKTDAERQVAKIQADAARKALDAASKAVRGAAARAAQSENAERVKAAERAKQVAQIELDRAKKAQAAVDRVHRDMAARAAELARKKQADPAWHVWETAKSYIAKNVDSGLPPDKFDDIRNKVATDVGLSVDKVTRLMTETKTAKRLADDVWKKQQQERLLKQQAQRWLTNLDVPGYKRAIQSVPRFLFGVKVGFHGTVALGTHAPMVLWQPRFWAAYVTDFGKMYKMVGSPAYYEHQVQDLVRRPNYTTARRAGLVNDPASYEDFNSPDMNSFMQKMTGMGNRGYTVLKILRQDMFDQHWDRLPKTAQIPEFAEQIADGVNHATGVVKAKAPAGLSTALFAPRLEASRAAWLVADPLKSLGTVLNWKNATPAERYFAVNQVKEKAWVAGTLFGLLTLNQGVLSATGSKQKINWLDPTRSDFLNFKVAGMDVSYGNAMLTMARLPIRLVANVKNEGKLNKVVYEDENVARTLFDYARSQAAPVTGMALDLGLGRDFQERPLPRAGFLTLPGKTNLPKRLRAQGVKPYTWTEYLSEQGPIPTEDPIREVWKKGMGMTDEQVTARRKAWAAAVAKAAVMGATGARVIDDNSPEAKQ